MASSSPAAGPRAEARAEFEQRLVEDLPLLRRSFGVEADNLDDVVDVRFDVGDPHRGGRTVSIVLFADGTRLVYKPRSLDAECHLNEMIRWFNGHLPRHALRASRVEARTGYGWCAFVTPRPCADEESVRRFYWRSGAWLALFHLIGAYDMHDENVIADGEHPVFVDLEALFRADVSSAEGHEPDAVDIALQNSALAVGLAPQCLVEIDDSGERATESSGLAGGHGPNRPVLRGEAVDPLPYGDHVVTGFQETYRLLYSRREDLLAPDGPLQAFAGDEVRQVLRHTSVYRSLRDQHQQDATGAQLMNALAGAPSPHRLGDRYPELLRSERRQLELGDIPVFFASTDNTALFDDTGPVVPGFLRQSGLDAACERLARFDEEDLRRQTWFVEASFAVLAGHRPGRHAQGHEPRPGNSVGDRRSATHETLLDAAVRLGDSLLHRAVRGRDGTVEWPSVQPVGSRYWTIGPSGLGLGAGVSGIILFLAELASISGHTRFRALAEDVVAVLTDPDAIPEPEFLLGMEPGAYGDLGGFVRVLTRLGNVWRQPELLDLAERLVPAMVLNFEASPALDVNEGTAGATLVLLGLAAARPGGPAEAAAGQAGKLLTSRVTGLLETGPPGTDRRPDGTAPAPAHDSGYAFGTPGIAHALAHCARFGGTELPRTVLSALLHGSGNGSASWCSGAAGSLLARVGVADAVRDLPNGAALMKDAADLAGPDMACVRAALARGIGDDSLCHGAMGMAEALLRAGQVFHDEEAVTCARHTLDRMAGSPVEDRRNYGVPRGTWTPGFLSGASGIGYGLLRALAPERVPSALLPDPAADMAGAPQKGR
jgi:type 2 lantibiotic biosynthesis protein LanM